MSYSVKHNKQFQKFYVNIGGREAFLKYEKSGEGILEFKTLFVPKNLRGVGVAERVLISAIGFAEKNNLKVKSSCAYVKKYIEDHPELKVIVSTGPDMHTWVLHYN